MVAKNLEIVVAGFRFLKVRTCVDPLLTHVTLVKTEHDRFVLKSAISKIYNRISIQIYEVHTISLQTFLVWAFKIVVDSWRFSMVLLYILWDDWPMFMISASNEQLRQQLEYTLLKPDCHSWWISKMQSDTLEERYAIKFCFTLGKKKCHRNVWNASNWFWSILHESSISFWVA